MEATPDYLKMIEALSAIRTNIKQKEKESLGGMDKDLGPDELDKEIMKVLLGKGNIPRNPFFKDGEIEPKSMSNSIKGYIDHCRHDTDEKTQMRPHFNMDGFVKYMNDKNEKENGETAALGDKGQDKEKDPNTKIIAEKLEKSKDEFEKTFQQQYHQYIIDILQNKDKGTVDPSKYYWAVEQLKYAEDVQYQVVETDKKQQLSFRVKFHGKEYQFFKSMDFKRTQEIQPVAARDLDDLAKISSYAKIKGMGQEVETAVNAPEVGKPPLGMDATLKQKVNKDANTKFETIKSQLGYDQSRNAGFWTSMGAKSEVLCQVIYMLRDTNGIAQEKTQEDTHEAEKTN